MTTADNYLQLKKIGDSFLDAFNRADLDAIMAHFAADAVYVELTGRRNEGKAAIRNAFEILYSGRFGEIRFDEDDTFIDAVNNKVMTTTSGR